MAKSQALLLSLDEVTESCGTHVAALSPWPMHNAEKSIL